MSKPSCDCCPGWCRNTKRKHINRLQIMIKLPGLSMSGQVQTIHAITWRPSQDSWSKSETTTSSSRIKSSRTNEPEIHDRERGELDDEEITKQRTKQIHQIPSVWSIWKSIYVMLLKIGVSWSFCRISRHCWSCSLQSSCWETGVLLVSLVRLVQSMPSAMHEIPSPISHVDLEMAWFKTPQLIVPRCWFQFTKTGRKNG